MEGQMQGLWRGLEVARLCVCGLLARLFSRWWKEFLAWQSQQSNKKVSELFSILVLQTLHSVFYLPTSLAGTELGSQSCLLSYYNKWRTASRQSCSKRVSQHLHGGYAKFLDIIVCTAWFTACGLERRRYITACN